MSKVLTHFGIPGMRWGHHKSREQQAHESRVKTLKSQIKQKQTNRWAKDESAFSKQEKAMYAKIDSIEKHKLAANDKQAKNAFDRMVGRGLIKMNARINRSNVVSKLEDKMIKEDDKRSAQAQKEKKEILKKWDIAAEKMYQRKVKGLKFPNNLKTALQLNKEMSRKIKEELLKVDAKYA